MKILITKGHVVDPSQELDRVMDVLIDGDKVALIKEDIDISGIDKTIDASKSIVCPGFIDMHVHLRDPGFEYKEDIATGTMAAVAGGFTSVACMPNTNPAADSRSVIEYIKSKAAREGKANVWPIGAITKGLLGGEMAEMGDMLAAGAVAFSDDSNPVINTDVMRLAMQYADMLGAPILDHCEDTHLTRDGGVNSGLVSTIMGFRGIPAVSEDIMVARDLLLARSLGTRVHICHVSTQGAVELIRWAKSEGIRVTAETAPHYFAATEDLVREMTYDSRTKVNPPLRSAQDLRAVKQGLKDGTIDAIATDHAPHHLDDKDVEYLYAANGISGLETAVSFTWTKLVMDGTLDVAGAVRKLTLNPARILGIDRGTLIPGKAADVTIIDPEQDVIVRPQSFYSRGKNNPFAGWQLRARPIITIVGGNVQYAWEE
jgi:dihydroorotase